MKNVKFMVAGLAVALICMGVAYVHFSGGGETGPSDAPTGVRRVADAMRRAGIRDVTDTLYPGGRHEMFNEVNADEALSDLIAWLDARGGRANAAR